jgi:hypothetical protein
VACAHAFGSRSRELSREFTDAAIGVRDETVQVAKKALNVFSGAHFV